MLDASFGMVKKGSKGLIKGDRQRVTVGLRQRRCSIAGREHQTPSSQEAHATSS